jgi:hypothetical protein
MHVVPLTNRRILGAAEAAGAAACWHPEIGIPRPENDLHISGNALMLRHHNASSTHWLMRLRPTASIRNSA